LLTLVVVPVGYSLVEDARAFLTKRRSHPTEATAHGD
jgi:hypothetical protein